jgi:hypothetical protein
MAGAGLFREKSTAGWLRLVAGAAVLFSQNKPAPAINYKFMSKGHNFGCNVRK